MTTAPAPQRTAPMTPPALTRRSTAIYLPLAMAAGFPPRRVPAVELAPGLFLYRGWRDCDCASCMDEITSPETCPSGTWSWRLSTAAGIGMIYPGWTTSVSELRQIATDLAAVTAMPFTHPDPDVQRATAQVPEIRAALQAVLRRMYRGDYAPPGEDRTPAPYATAPNRAAA